MFLTFDSSAPAAARHAVRAGLDQSHLPADLVDDSLLVLSELVTNAVRHGQPMPWPPPQLEVSWSVTADALRLEVGDGGDGNPLQGSAAASAEGGRGLAIVDALCSHWGVSRCEAGTTTVWASLERGE